MRLQRIRGASFREEYARSSLAVLRRARREMAASSRSAAAVKTLIAPKESQYADRITVVLDLDETLVYAREGPLYVRPGLEELLQFLNDNCETVVWTAGIKPYAEAVVRNIDTNGAVRHTISRDSKWFKGNSTCKDLRLLGRDTATTIVFENTPDCIRGFEQNGVLVSDYEGGELEDHTLYVILALLKDLVRRHGDEHVTVPEFIRSARCVSLREVPTDDGDLMSCYCLNTHNADMESIKCNFARRRIRNDVENPLNITVH